MSGVTPVEAWQELCERDDRTSPEEYPGMCLITQPELAEFMRRAATLAAVSEPTSDDYDRGRRDMLNAILALNPTVAAKLARLKEREPDPYGRLPFDVAFWVTEVAAQLGIEPKECE